MQIFLDESGDLGWNFSAPRKHGGSSRYLTLAFLFLPHSCRNAPRRLVRSLYHLYSWKHEHKASHATLNQKITFCQKAHAMLGRHPGIKVDVITVKKENVKPHIRADANKLYNYMSGLIIPQYLDSETEVEFIPDARSIKVKSGNSLVDYLQIRLWFDCNSPTVIKNNPCESHRSYSLQFLDWIAHCVWKHHEDRTSEPFDILQPVITSRSLFFSH